MSTSGVITSGSLNQRRTLASEAASVNNKNDKNNGNHNTNGYAHAEIPDESDSDNDVDITKDQDDTDWIAMDAVKRTDVGASVEGVDSDTLNAIEALVKKYETPDDKIAWRLLLPALIAFILLTLAAPLIITKSIFISLPWLFIVGGLRVRLFIIFHDCGHGSFFEKHKDNMKIGRLLELCVATPFNLWLKRHNRHHRVQGNSDKLDLSSTVPITVAEYYSLSSAKRYFFRVIRDPLLFYIVTPFLIWDLFYVILHGTKRIFFSRLAVAAFFAYATNSIIQGLLWEQAFTYVPGLIGLVLFHLQHSANGGYRARDSDHSARQTALKGSTYVTVPSLLRWITLNIEFHHIHHWSTRVPSYRLEDCHNDGEAKGMWSCITRVDTPKKFIDALFNVLWCDKRQRYITFWEL